jgi:hypothetical protein
VEFARGGETSRCGALYEFSRIAVDPSKAASSSLSASRARGRSRASDTFADMALSIGPNGREAGQEHGIQVLSGACPFAGRADQRRELGEDSTAITWFRLLPQRPASGQLIVADIQMQQKPLCVDGDFIAFCDQGDSAAFECLIPTSADADS